MSLATDARQLLAALKMMVTALEQYADDNRAVLTRRWAKQLRPLVEAFEDCVIQQRDRIQAATVLEEIAPLVHAVGAASTKGEMPLFAETDDIMNTCLDLEPIFRESRYRHERL